MRGAPGTWGDLVGPCDRLKRGLSGEDPGGSSGAGGAAASGSGAPLAAAAAPLRSLPRRVEALPQRRALPAPLLRPRRAAGVRAMATRPGQLSRVGGAPERGGSGAPRQPGWGGVGGAEPPGRLSAQATLAPAPGPGILESTAEGLPLSVLFFLSRNTKN